MYPMENSRILEKPFVHSMVTVFRLMKKIVIKSRQIGTIPYIAYYEWKNSQLVSPSDLF